MKRAFTGRHLVAATVILLLLQACTTTAPPQRYYPDPDNPPWIIGGSLHGTSGELQITIDGETVMQGRLPSFQESLKLDGSYRERNIHADCSMQYCSGGIQCTLFVDGKSVGILDFSGL